MALAPQLNRSPPYLSRALHGLSRAVDQLNQTFFWQRRPTVRLAGHQMHFDQLRRRELIMLLGRAAV